MSARLTIVLDDESLYRDLKVRAAQDGVPLKVLIERMARDYLGAERHSSPRVLTPEMLDEWFAEADRLAEQLPPDVPTDLSDVKHYLYGRPKRKYSPEQWGEMAAEANRKHGP